MKTFYRSLIILIPLFLIIAIHTRESSAQEDEFLRFGYINNPTEVWDWGQYDQLFDGSYTHIIATFLIPQGDGSISGWDAINAFDAALIKRAHDNGIYVIASIGGATTPYLTYLTIAKNPASRTKFISEALRIMHEKGYDGLDINFEGWYSGLTEADRSYGNGLGEELAQAIKDDDPANIVTLALAPAYWLPMSFTCEFANSNLVDYAHHMSYDFFWGTMKSANGPFRAPGEILYPYLETSPIERSIYGALNYLFNKGCNPSKMTAGLPFYSTHVEAWNSIRNRADWESIPLDPDYLEKLEKEEERYNWVNDPEAIAAKIEEYKKLGLAGIIVWQVGHEGTTGDLSEAVYRASTGGSPPTYACSDGRDNDLDGLIDFPNDPGCLSITDNDEFDEPEPHVACFDGIDNDSDGLVDYPNDPGCMNEEDDSETDEAGSGDITTSLSISSDWGTGYCANVIVKNNGSSAVDWTTTVETEGPISSLWNAAYSQSGNEVTAQGLSWNKTLQPAGSASFGFCAAREEAPPPPTYECSDSIDNDGDNLVDYPNDPGCEGKQDDDEYNAPPQIYECSDGIDNDADQLVDYPEDPGCANPSDDDEYNSPQPGGDISTELITTSDWGSGYCASVAIKNNGGNAVDWAITFNIEGRITSLWNASYVQNGNEVSAEGLSWNNIVQPGQTKNLGFCASR